MSSSAQHALVELAADGETVLRRIGTGARGRADGGPTQAQFSEPQGLCALPADVAETAGYDVVVADTVNHLLRGVRLADGTVTTIAGTGRPLRSEPGAGAHDALAVDLSSPWDVAWFDDKVIIAMAGVHQLWWFDPIKRTTGIYAGTSVEALKDGPLAEVWMAQPSGLSAVGRPALARRQRIVGRAVGVRRRDAHRRGPGPVRLRTRRRPGRIRALPAPARRLRAARRIGARRRHI